mmetsp:Transcript_6117/g.23141  ORF Transcript_6117/g.23141 Transcript_6117/m.23141 type:complete len:249 (-) Transcript_6117:556-1302(-)
MAFGIEPGRNHDATPHAASKHPISNDKVPADLLGTADASAQRPPTLEHTLTEKQAHETYRSTSLVAYKRKGGSKRRRRRRRRRRCPRWSALLLLPLVAEQRLQTRAAPALSDIEGAPAVAVARLLPGPATQEQRAHLLVTMNDTHHQRRVTVTPVRGLDVGTRIQQALGHAGEAEAARVVKGRPTFLIRRILRSDGKQVQEPLRHPVACLALVEVAVAAAPQNGAPRHVILGATVAREADGIRGEAAQ